MTAESLSSNPLRLSYSSLETLSECERKFQLDKLLVGETNREESEHFSFGHGFGVGIATYLVTQDQDRALYEAWLAYWPEIETEKKNVALCLAAIMASFQPLDDLLAEYEVISFNGKPAVELSFKLDINPSYYFVGHIDVVLRNRYSGVCVVLDAKTTGSQLLDLSPMYKHSGQTVGYSIALDKIVGKQLSSYGVMYFVAQIGKDYKIKIHPLLFEKTLMDRLQWFITLGMDVKRLEQMTEMGIFPKRARSCLNFNRPCKYFGTCHLHSFDKMKVQEPDPTVYDFSYNLDELVEDHIARINAEPPREERKEDDLCQLA